MIDLLFWKIFGGLGRGYVRLIRSTNRRISAAFSPTASSMPPDGLRDRVRPFRTVLGLAVITWATVRYAPIDDPQFYGGLVGSAVESPLRKAPVAFGVFALAALPLYIAASPAERRPLLSCLAKPMLTAGIVGAVVVVFVIVPLGFGAPFVTPEAALTDGTGSEYGNVLIGAWIYLFAFALPVIYWTAYLGVKTSFNAAEGHPFLPAFVAVGISIWGIVSAVRTEMNGGGEPYFPPIVRLALGFGGALVTLGLAVWEIRRLYRQGIRMSSPRPQLPASKG